MKNKSILLALFLLVLTASNTCFAGSKNFLKQLFKVYQDYEEVNMLLWLTGDVRAEKLLGKELAFWQQLTSKKEGDQAKSYRPETDCYPCPSETESGTITPIGSQINS